jgi:hypothetical protein
LERITMKEIENQFEKWAKNAVQRIRGYHKGAGKTYKYLDKYIVFTVPEDSVCFYNITLDEHYVLPKKLLNFALNFIED